MQSHTDISVVYYDACRLAVWEVTVEKSRQPSDGGDVVSVV